MREFSNGWLFSAEIAAAAASALSKFLRLVKAAIAIKGGDLGFSRGNANVGQANDTRDSVFKGGLAISTNDEDPVVLVPWVCWWTMEPWCDVALFFLLGRRLRAAAAAHE